MSVSTVVGYSLFLVVGALALWYKSNATLRSKATELISAAEQEYSGAIKAGGKKFEWVVDQLYALLPAPVRPFVPRSLVASMVQTTFDAVQGYAKQQLDRLANQLLSKGDKLHG